jgi:hypothetical protein
VNDAFEDVLRFRVGSEDELEVLEGLEESRAGVWFRVRD